MCSRKRDFDVSKFVVEYLKPTMLHKTIFRFRMFYNSNVCDSGNQQSSQCPIIVSQLAQISCNYLLIDHLILYVRSISLLRFRFSYLNRQLGLGHSIVPVQNNAPKDQMIDRLKLENHFFCQNSYSKPLVLNTTYNQPVKSLSNQLLSG